MKVAAVLFLGGMVPSLFSLLYIGSTSCHVNCRMSIAEFAGIAGLALLIAAVVRAGYAIRRRAQS